MKTKYWVILFAAVALVCVVAIVLLPLPQGAANSAELYQNGTLIRTVSLDEDTRFTVSAPSGGSNSVVVADGRIRVEQADCPDKLCVKQGWSRTRDYPIVCLPHGLIIQPTGNEVDFDAVAN